jgi:hypothetical protein
LCSGISISAVLYPEVLYRLGPLTKITHSALMELLKTKKAKQIEMFLSEQVTVLHGAGVLPLMIKCLPKIEADGDLLMHLYDVIF